MDELPLLLFNSFPYANLVLKVGPQQELTLAMGNEAAGALYGLNPQALKDKQLHHVLVRQMADFLEEAGRACLKAQKTITTEPKALHPVTDAQQSFVVNPLFDADGRITYIDIIALPFEASKLELLKERDHALMLMSSAFDASNLGIFVTDRDRRILRVNEAFIREFGFKRRELIGQDFTQIFVPADKRAVAKAYKSFLRGQAEARHEWRIKTHDGKISDVLATTAPLHLHPDRPLVVHTLVDISEHKHLEESLRWAKEQADAANRSKSAFLASMSHELRTPLNAILGFSELMKNETFGSVGHPKYAEYLKDIHFAAGHLLEIINDVLDMSKIEAGKFELVEEEIDLNNLAQSTLRVMADRAESHCLFLQAQVEAGLVALYGDKRVVRQMLFNLLSNAIKFSKPGGTVNLDIRREIGSGKLLMAVRDRGRGIAAADLQRVLEPFNQGQAHVSDGAGTGLGLPLTRAMAELHQGTLRIESKLGRGTTVTIVLPGERLVEPAVTSSNGRTRRQQDKNKAEATAAPATHSD